MKIVLASDMQEPIVNHIREWLTAHSHDVNCFQPSDITPLLWPEAAEKVAASVQRQEADCGILLCWTGTGVCIAANKFKGIRAALCKDTETAKGSKLWNNANVLCLSLNDLSESKSEEIISTWLHTDYIPTEDEEACMQMLEEIENPSHERQG